MSHLWNYQITWFLTMVFLLKLLIVKAVLLLIITLKIKILYKIASVSILIQIFIVMLANKDTVVLLKKIMEIDTWPVRIWFWGVEKQFIMDFTWIVLLIWRTIFLLSVGFLAINAMKQIKYPSLICFWMRMIKLLTQAWDHSDIIIIAQFPLTRSLKKVNWFSVMNLQQMGYWFLQINSVKILQKIVPLV